MQNKPRVLFLCTGNSCRSQMAEGLLRHFGCGNFDVYSAGLRPSFVHPLAIKAMAELGIDITNQHSKTVNEFLDQKFSYIITVCSGAKERCPAFQGNHNALHWNIDDPAIARGTEEKMMKAFKDTRDKISDEVDHFISKMGK